VGVSVVGRQDAWAIQLPRFGAAVWMGPSSLLHWDGSAWSLVALGELAAGEYPTGVVALGPSDVWTATTSGDALHWNGSAWSRSHTGATQPLSLVASGSRIYGLGLGNGDAGGALLSHAR
jgi:hypothetical protein